MENQISKWAYSWNKALPTLALVGPVCWLIAALVRAVGIGKLSGDLSWVSAPEGVIMVIGVPFFVATFIFMGQRVAERFHKTGIVVTVLGIMGISFLAFVSGFRVLAKIFVDAGINPNTINTAFESESIWALPLLVLNLGQFIAWIITGVVIIRTKLAPRWSGLVLILGVISLISAQA